MHLGMIEHPLTDPEFWSIVESIRCAHDCGDSAATPPTSHRSVGPLDSLDDQMWPRSGLHGASCVLPGTSHFGTDVDDKIDVRFVALVYSKRHWTIL